VPSQPDPGSANPGSRHLPVPPVHGLVKWFNPEKGFGFVELSDGSGDAFLHGSVLDQNGINVVRPGETLEVRIGPGHKGPHVTEVLSVDTSTAVPAPPRRSNFGATTSNGSSSGIAVEETGTVKWFNAEKGFGFMLVIAAGRTFSSTPPLLSDPGSPASAKGNTSLSLSMSSRVERGWKRRGFA
jgi:cold shock protein